MKKKLTMAFLLLGGSVSMLVAAGVIKVESTAALLTALLFELMVVAFLIKVVIGLKKRRASREGQSEGQLTETPRET